MPSAIQNPFDHASRGLVRRAGLLMLAWLPRVAASSIRFERCPVRTERPRPSWLARLARQEVRHVTH
jgi:hypothetical protein